MLREGKIGLRAVLSAAAIAVVLVTSARPQIEAEPSDGSTLIGVYELIEYAPHGDRPTGRIAYDGAGRMWAMLLPPERAPVTRTSTPEEYRTAMRGLVAYYGKYEVDEATHRVIHRVEAASNPAWIGDVFVRWYRFEDDDLRLSLNPEFENALLWGRLPEE